MYQRRGERLSDQEPQSSIAAIHTASERSGSMKRIEKAAQND